MRAVPSPRPRVLLADADPIAGGLLAQMLHLAGFDCLQAATGERALLLLREHRDGIDWLVTAADLPGLVDQAILADEYQEFHPGRPIVSITAAEAAPSGRRAIIEIARTAPQAVIALIETLKCQPATDAARALAA